MPGTFLQERQILPAGSEEHSSVERNGGGGLMANMCVCPCSWAQYKGPASYRSPIACFKQMGWAIVFSGLRITGCAYKALKKQPPTWSQEPLPSSHPYVPQVRLKLRQEIKPTSDTPGLTWRLGPGYLESVPLIPAFYQLKALHLASLLGRTGEFVCLLLNVLDLQPIK